jgi:hypothetical protein
MRVKLLRVVNVVLFVTITHQFLTGLFPVLYGEWNFVIHQIGSYVVLACVAAHLVLNWGWIKSTYLKRK